MPQIGQKSFKSQSNVNQQFINWEDIRKEKMRIPGFRTSSGSSTIRLAILPDVGDVLCDSQYFGFSLGEETRSLSADFRNRKNETMRNSRAPEVRPAHEQSSMFSWFVVCTCVSLRLLVCPCVFLVSPFVSLCLLVCSSVFICVLCVVVCLCVP